MTNEIIIHEISNGKNNPTNKDIDKTNEIETQQIEKSMPKVENSDLPKAIVFSATIFAGALLYFATLNFHVDGYFPTLIFLLICNFAYKLFFSKD